MNYKMGFNAYLKGLNRPKIDKAVFIEKDSKPYWVVVSEYLGKSKSVACRNLTQAICLSIRTNGYIRQYGDYGVSSMERTHISAICKL